MRATSRLAAAVLSLLTCVYGGRLSAEEYKLDRGDVLGISVFGMPDFNRRTTLNVDGKISLPLIGSVTAAGLTLEQLQQRIKELLAGLEISRSSEVMVELAEPRPFYVSGDVTTPGALPWRFGLDVRRAVALAGGVGTTRLRNLESPQSAAEIQGRYNAALVELARRDARLRGLETELAGEKTISFETSPKLPIPAKILQRIRQLEQKNLDERYANLEHEREHLTNQIEIGAQQVETLEQGREQDKLTVAQQVNALQLATSLQNRGLANVARVSDEQRALSLIRSRELETIARLGRARQDREEQSRKLERLTEDRRMLLSRDVQTAILDVQQTRSELSGLAERLVLARSMAGQITSMASNIEYLIHRRNGDRSQRIAATPETSVDPGDVVEVLLKLEGFPQSFSSVEQ